MSALHANDELTDVSHSRQNVRLAEIPTWAEICNKKREKLAKNVAPAESYKERLLQEKIAALEPLEGFIQITTTEPDMISDDDDPNSKRAKMPCGHVIGPDSMTRYCQDLLSKGKYKFYCPSNECDREWDYFLVRHVACLSPDEVKEIEKKISNNYLQREKGIQTCPGCMAWCYKEADTGNYVACPLCRKSFCWACLRDWIDLDNEKSCGNSGCDGRDSKTRVLANCPTKRIGKCRKCPTIRACPKCGMLIEHKEACAHVTCSNCKHCFCFICLKGDDIDNYWSCSYEGTCSLAQRQSGGSCTIL